MEAGIVFAKLVLGHQDLLRDSEKRGFALHAIRVAAEAGHGEALWLWAQVCRGEMFGLLPPDHFRSTKIDDESRKKERGAEEWQGWAERAALKGIEAARHALETEAWNKRDYRLYLEWAWPPARIILQAAAHSSKVLAALNAREVELLKRCAIALHASRQALPEEIQSYWEAAAQTGDAQAQFSLGLLLAKMDSSGQRADTGVKRVIYKKALRWLEMAAQQGIADAYYVISRIYLKPEFSQRSAALSQQYLQQAAQAGHVQSQLELGKELWRKGSAENEEDVQALHWLSQAAAQGNSEAQAWIRENASAGAPQAWAKQAGEQLGGDHFRNERLHQAPSKSSPQSQYLAARVELALHFSLSRAEALLLDVAKADKNHCLVVDIRDHHPRSKRRLIAMQDEGMRQRVRRIRHLFHEVDSSENGPEGNYRRRLYRLKNLTGQASSSVRAVPGVISRSRLRTQWPPDRSS